VGAVPRHGGAWLGLGLAIVRDLAELHEGLITLDRSPTGGLRATLELPAAQAAEPQ